jgi:hypothetical protein
VVCISRLRELEGSVERASNAERAAIENVGVDHGGGNVAVAQELLDRSDVVARFEQMSGKRVAQRVARGGLGDAGRLHCASKGSLKDGFVEVVPATLAGVGVDVEACCWEHPLPRPFSCGGWILETECAGELDVARAGAEVGRVLALGSFELPPEIGRDGLWEERDAILQALALPNDDLTRAEVQVLDTQSGALGDAQAGTVEKSSHEERRIFQVFEDATNLVAREYDGQARDPYRALQIQEPWRIHA